MLYELSPGEELSVSYKNGSVSTIKQDVAYYVSRLEEWYPDESVRSKGVDATPGVKFDVDYRDVVNHTIGVLPFCVLADSTYSNSHLSGRVVIPPYVDVEGERYTVTGIVYVDDPNWDVWNENLTELVLPNTVKDIWMCALYGCRAVSAVSLPGVDNIDVGAFYTCQALQSVQAPAVTCLNNAAIADCDSLTSVEFPSAAVISSYALNLNEGLRYVSLPAVEFIEEGAFSYGVSLSVVDFGDKLTSVPVLLSTDAFNDVPTSCEIRVPDALYDDWITAPKWNELYAAGYKFVRNGEMKNYMRKRDFAQFAEWYPDGSVMSEDDFTSGIKFDIEHRDQMNYTIDARPFCALENNVSSNIHLSGRVVIPPYVDVEGKRYTVTGIQAADPHWAFWNENLTELVMPTTVRDIQMYAVYGCTAISSVSLPGVDNIDVAAFCMCSSLQSVQAPAVTCLNEVAFGACDSLTSVEFPSATVVSSYALDICSALQHVFLPAAEVIGENVFSLGDSLELVDFGDKLTSVPTLLSANAFEGVPTTCAICVPDALYDAWTSAPEWNKLYAAGYKFIRKGEKGYVRKHEVVDKTTLTQVLAPFKNLEYDDGYDVDIDTVVSALVQLANLT